MTLNLMVPYFDGEVQEGLVVFEAFEPWDEEVGVVLCSGHLPTWTHCLEVKWISAKKHSQLGFQHFIRAVRIPWICRNLWI